MLIFFSFLSFSFISFSFLYSFPSQSALSLSLSSHPSLTFLSLSLTLTLFSSLFSWNTHIAALSLPSWPKLGEQRDESPLYPLHSLPHCVSISLFSSNFRSCGQLSKKKKKRKEEGESLEKKSSLGSRFLGKSVVLCWVVLCVGCWCYEFENRNPRCV